MHVNVLMHMPWINALQRPSDAMRPLRGARWPAVERAASIVGHPNADSAE
jgi:hypothetical protein